MSIKIIDQLNEDLLRQAFDGNVVTDMERYYRHIAAMYSAMENSIAVLSNMKESRSYIYYGGAGERLGIANKGDIHEIHSIWEEEILSHVYPSDLISKQLQELHFFHFVKSQPTNCRHDYCMESTLRMSDADGNLHPMSHRIFYFSPQDSESLHFALCIYNFTTQATNQSGHIINTATGDVIQLLPRDFLSPLSERETEILKLIAYGKRSKEIAESLHISINTVNRHRQNILEKLNVSNSMEACNLAQRLQLI